MSEAVLVAASSSASGTETDLATDVKHARNGGGMTLVLKSGGEPASGTEA